MNFKIAFLATLFLSLNSIASSIIDSCNYEIDSAVYSVEVNVDSNGIVGNAYSEYQKVIDTKEVISVMTPKLNFKTDPHVGFAMHLAGQMGLDISSADSAWVTNIDPRGNFEDATGAMIATFFEKSGKVLAKFGQVGWGYGICK